MTDRNDRFDVLLGKVLREESAVEPVAGLEERVMARVREGTFASLRWRFAAWAGGLGLAAAVVVLVVLLPGRHEVRAVGHDGLAASNPAATHGLPSGAKAPSTSTIYGTAEAVPLSKTRPRLDGAVRRVNTETTVARRRTAAGVAEARLPKLDVFPSPATVDVFPAPVVGGQDAAESLSPKAAEALMALQKEQKEAIQIAAIVIAPLNPER